MSQLISTPLVISLILILVLLIFFFVVVIVRFNRRINYLQSHIDSELITIIQNFNENIKFNLSKHKNSEDKLTSINSKINVEFLNNKQFVINYNKERLKTQNILSNLANKQTITTKDINAINKEVDNLKSMFKKLNKKS